MNNRELVLGMVLGAGFMYLMDPDRGRRRRALVRDQMIHGGHRLEDSANARARDLGNRARGAAAEASSRMRPDTADEAVLRERARTAIGRETRNPGSIQISVENGRATLRGPVLAEEVQSVVRAVRGVRGIQHVENQLDVHETAENVPGLQGADR